MNICLKLIESTTSFNNIFAIKLYVVSDIYLYNKNNLNTYLYVYSDCQSDYLKE